MINIYSQINCIRVQQHQQYLVELQPAWFKIVQYWYATSMTDLHTLEYMLATALLLCDDWTLCVTGWPQYCCCVTTGHCVLRVGHSTVVV